MDQSNRFIRVRLTGLLSCTCSQGSAQNLRIGFFSLFLIFHGYSSTVGPIFPALSSSIQPIPLPQSIPHCCPRPWVIHTGCLTSPFPSPQATFSLFHDSMPLVLFGSLVYFVHYIALIGEIIWYLSFTNWLISISIILSSSIHAVTKGRGSFFLSAV